jgi:subtilisin family serine protease
MIIYKKWLSTLAFILPFSLTALSANPADAFPRRIKETIFKTMDYQTPAGWGLDRIDGAKDGKYEYVGNGKSVRIYIVDTGVDANHPELAGRVLQGFDAFNQNLSQSDCNGHGTHVAGVVAGTTYGVAKAASVVPVRVLNCSGQGNTSSLLAGINWILSAHPGGSIGIVNMSLGGAKSDQANAAVAKLIDAGLVVVAAAGNSNVDACTFSPASAPGVIAVGATDESDTRASFSNWGSCVDVFAPGVRINSANAANFSLPASRSGTSAASPFVAGAIATYVSSNKVLNSKDALPTLLSLGESGVVKNSSFSNNYLVNVEKAFSVAPAPDPVPSPTPEPNQVQPPEAVSAVQAGAGSFFGTLSWTLVAGTTSYLIYKTGSIRPGWRQFASAPAGTNSMSISDKPGAVAIYRIVAIVSGSEVEVGTVKYFPSR